VVKNRLGVEAILYNSLNFSENKQEEM